MGNADEEDRTESIRETDNNYIFTVPIDSKWRGYVAKTQMYFKNHPVASFSKSDIHTIIDDVLKDMKLLEGRTKYNHVGFKHTIGDLMFEVLVNRERVMMALGTNMVQSIYLTVKNGEYTGSFYGWENARPLPDFYDYLPEGLAKRLREIELMYNLIGYSGFRKV